MDRIVPLEGTGWVQVGGLSAGWHAYWPAGLGWNAQNFAYFLAPSLWGRGLMTEAPQRFLPWTCLRFELDQITVDHFADNPSSGRVLEKLGFVKTGSARLGSAARIGTALGYTYCLDCEHLAALPTHE